MKRLLSLILCVLLAISLFPATAFAVDGEPEPEASMTEVAETPAEDPPAEDPPAEDPPAEDPPAEDPPAEDPPAEDPPAEDPPAEDPPAEDPLAEDPPVEVIPCTEPGCTLADGHEGAHAFGAEGVICTAYGCAVSGVHSEHQTDALCVKTPHCKLLNNHEGDCVLFTAEEQLTDAIAAGGSVSFDGDVTLSADLVIPAGVTLTLSGALTVPENVTLRNEGTLEINGTAEIGGTLENAGEIHVHGEMTFGERAVFADTENAIVVYIDGAVTGSDRWVTASPTPKGISGEETALRAAIDNLETEYLLQNDLTLSADLSIPESFLLQSGGYTITVPSGCNLTVRGILEIQSEGTLVNNGGVDCYGTLTVTGTYSCSSGMLYLNDDATITGVANIDIFRWAVASSETELRAVLEECDTYGSVFVDVSETAVPITLTEDLTIPANGEVELSGALLTVATDVTLTVEGVLELYDASTLTVQDGGAVIINGSWYVEDGSTVIGDVTDNTVEPPADEVYVDTYASLKQALADGVEEINVTGSFSLEEDLSIPEDVNLNVLGDGCVLTVPAGKTLTVRGGLYILSDTALRVAGTLNNFFYIFVGDSGTLSVTGTYYVDSYIDAPLLCYAGSSISGVPKGKIGYITYPQTEAQLRAAMQLTGYESVRVYLDASDITLTANLTIPANTDLYVGFTSDFSGLTIPEGRTLTVNGELYVSEDFGWLENEGTVVVNGLCSLNNMYGYGELVDNTSHFISTFEELADAIARKVGWISIEDSFAIRSNLTIPANVTVNVTETCALTVPVGLTLTVDGSLEVSGVLQVNGTLLNRGSIDVIGALRIADGVYSGRKGDLYQRSGAEVSGIASKYIYRELTVTTEAALRSAMTASSYRSLDVCISEGTVTLTDDLVVPSGVLISVSNWEDGNAAKLVVPDGVTLTVAGRLLVVDAGTLQIDAGGTVEIEETGWMSNYGTEEYNGTLTDANEGSSISSAEVTSYSELLAALEEGVGIITVRGSIRLMGNLVIAEDQAVFVEGALVIPSGRTLTVNGSIFAWNGSSSIQVQAKGGLRNNGYIRIDSGSLVVATGGIYSAGAESRLIQAYGSGSVSGIAKTKIKLQAYASTEAQLRSYLTLCDGYQVDSAVILREDIVLTSRLSIPASVMLCLDETDYAGDGYVLTVPSGITLTNNGKIYATEGGVNVRPGGVLVNNGRLDVTSNGVLTEDGTLANNGQTSISVPVSSQAELQAALAQGASRIVVKASFGITGDITVPVGTDLEFNDSAPVTLSVTSGTLTLEGDTYLFETDDTLTVAEGAALRNLGYMHVEGILAVYGSYYQSSVAQLTVTDTCTVIGVNGSLITFRWNVSDETGLRAALDHPEYASNTVMLEGDVTLTADLNVPANTIIYLIDTGAALTVPDGVTLTNAGEIQVDAPALLFVDGGRFVNNGSLYAEEDAFVDSGTVEDLNGELYYTTYLYGALTADALLSAIGKGAQMIYVNGDLTLNKSVTIPETVTVIVFGTLTVARGYTLTCRGYIRLCDEGIMRVLGTYRGTRVYVEKGSLLTPGSVPRCLEGVRATGVIIAGDANGKVGVGVDTQFTATFTPDTAAVWTQREPVVWSVENGTGMATIHSETGVLTATGLGTVTITATARDNGAVAESRTIEIVSYSTTISGGDEVLSGKTLTLTGGYIPGNLTGTKLVWRLGDGDSAYASISQTGVLTAKSVTEAHTVTVTLATADGMAVEAEHVVTIRPYATGVQLYLGDEEVTGMTRKLDMNEAEEFVLTAAAYPSDARQEFTWSNSSPTLATRAEDGTLTLKKAGKVTFKATAKDGSGKYQTVTLMISAVSDGLTITGATEVVSGRSVQLTRTFTDPQPTNTGVTWSIAPEHALYAQVSTTGLVTALAVTEAKEITVRATAKDGGCYAEHTLVIKPLVQTMLIEGPAGYATGTTVRYDLNAGAESMTFRATLLPNDANGALVWKQSYNAGAYATYTQDEDGSLTVTPTGKTGTVTLTAAAQDGSRKTAWVKVQFCKLAQDITILNAPEHLRGGAGSTLKTDVATVAGLTDRTVLWTVNGEAKAYASVSSRGVLTTKPVPVPTAITVTATVKATNVSKQANIMLYPAVSKATILYGGLPMASGQLLSLDLNTETPSLQLGMRFDPEGQTLPGAWKWTSSSPSVISVDQDGKVTPVQKTDGTYKTGTVTIKLAATDGSGKYATVRVKAGYAVTGITVSAAAETLISGKTLRLTAAVEPANATTKSVTWSVEDAADKAYASISSTGLVTAKTVYEPHTVEFLAKATDGSGRYDRYSVTILPKPGLLTVYLGDENVTKKTLSLDLRDGGTISLDPEGVDGLQLTAKTAGEDEAGVKWSSQYRSYATVDATGKVTGIRVGTTVITAKAADGRTATVTVKVGKLATDVTVGVKYNYPPIVASGKRLYLTSTVGPTDTTSKSVVWSLTEESKAYASISSTGVLTAKSGIYERRTVTAIATAKDGGGASDSLTVTVCPLATGVQIMKDGLAMISGTTQTVDLMQTTEYTGLSALVCRPGLARDGVTWTLSGTYGAARIDANTGVISLYKPGTVTVTAKALDGSGKYQTFKLVIVNKLTTITPATGVTLRGGGKLTLSKLLTLNPTKPTNATLRYTMNPEDLLYASVSSSGTLTARKVTMPVEVMVRVTSTYDTSVYADITILLQPATTSVAVLRDMAVVTGKTQQLNLTEGQTTCQLTAQCWPGTANQGVTWRSSNTRIATVDKYTGLVTAVPSTTPGLYKTGTVTITATAADGSGKYATVKVTFAYLTRTITLTATQTTLRYAQRVKITPTFDPTNATSKSVTWSLRPQDMAYASISTTGWVTGKRVTADKTIVVTCKSKDYGGTIATFTLTVTP